MDKQPFDSPSKNSNIYSPISYNPTDPTIECFGIEIAMRNKDLEMFQFLWTDQKFIWEERHLSYILALAIEQDWDEGIKAVL